MRQDGAEIGPGAAPAPRTIEVLRAVGKIFYWVAVLAISLALLVALVLFFESRDQSSLQETGSTPSSSANTMIRSAAL